MNPNDREDIMRHWDSWHKYIAEGGECSWPRDAFESLLDHFEEISMKTKYISLELTGQNLSIANFEYDDLLEKVKWYFELMDAMDTVRTLLLSSVFRQPKRYDAYQRLAIMAREAESELRKII